MRFSIFDRVNDGSHGRLCTWEEFLNAVESKAVAEKAAAVAHGDKKPKEQLPAVTWQAYFPEGRRDSHKAQPSGLYMLDIDHMSDPVGKVYEQQVARHIKRLGIRVVHKTVSCHGLRIVADCQPGFTTIEENQRWLAEQLGVEFDPVCKDWARASFLVPHEYFYYLDGSIFDPNLSAPVVLEVGAAAPAAAPALAAPAANPAPAASVPAAPVPAASTTVAEAAAPLQTAFKGLPLTFIAQQWLDQSGGMPHEGERNSRLYALALRMRYITEFNPAVIAAALPSLGLPDSEVRSLCNSACNANRAGDMPSDMRHLLTGLLREKERQENEAQEGQQPTESEEPEDHLDENGNPAVELCDTSQLPPLPPIFKQVVDNTPQDFKQAMIPCMLPVLGTLGSRLRARYDGERQTPSFLVCLVAPQASGKSFITQMQHKLMADLIEHDQQERAIEEQYKEKEYKTKLMTKMSKKEQEEILGDRPRTVVRLLPPTVSIGKFLKRMEAAQELHLFSISEELDAVRKSYRSDFSNLSVMLRQSFDNSQYGQDYLNNDTFSGMVDIYFNVLYAGTEGAARRFFPNVEDGLVSRVLFVSLPSQFGKRKPRWNWDGFTPKQESVLNYQLARLNGLCYVGDAIQPEHEMEMPWLTRFILDWCYRQQDMAVSTDDVDRDTYCRRAGVMGFRAGMLAYYLYEESDKPSVRKKVCLFAQWVANYALKHLLQRFSTTQQTSEHFFARPIYENLPDTFTVAQLQAELDAANMDTGYRVVISRWKLVHRVACNKAYGATEFTKVKI